MLLAKIVWFEPCLHVLSRNLPREPTMKLSRRIVLTSLVALIATIVCALSFAILRLAIIVDIPHCIQPVSLPYIYEKGFHVRIQACRKSVNLLVDTGCASLLKKKLLKESGAVRLFTAPRPSRDLDGFVHKKSTFLLDSLCAGQYCARGVPFVQIEEDDHFNGFIKDGILGYTFLQHYAWLFDGMSQMVSFADSISFLRVDTCGFHVAQNALRASARWRGSIASSVGNGVACNLVLDLGNTISGFHVDTKTFSRLAETHPYETYFVMGWKGKATTKHVFRGMETVVSGDSVVCDIVHEEGINKNLLGAPFFEHRSFVLDYPQNRLFFKSVSTQADTVHVAVPKVNDYGIRVGKRDGERVVTAVKAGSQADLDGIRPGQRWSE